MRVVTFYRAPSQTGAIHNFLQQLVNGCYVCSEELLCSYHSNRQLL